MRHEKSDDARSVFLKELVQDSSYCSFGLVQGPYVLFRLQS